MPRLTDRKALSNIVTAVMLIAIVISISALVGSFFPQVFFNTAQDTKNQTERVLDSSKYSIQIERAELNTPTDTLTVTLGNKGEKINGNITVTAFCDEKVVERTITGLNDAEIRRANLNNLDCDVKNVKAILEDYPISDEENEINVLGRATLSYIGQDFSSRADSATNIVYSPLKLEANQNSVQETSTFSGSKTNLTVTGGELKLATK